MKDQALTALTSLGLSLGEAKTYLALATVRSSEATPLADIADVPQPKIYSYLDRLASRGLIDKQEIEGKPNIYSAEDIDVVFTKLRESLDKDITVAKQYIREKQQINEDSTSGLVTVIQGEQAIRRRIKTIAQSLERNVLLLYHNHFSNLVNTVFDPLDIPIIRPLQHLEDNPMLNMILNSPLAGRIREKKIMLIIPDVDIKNKDASSVNIIAVGDINIDPVMIQISHPVIIEFQMDIISEIINEFANLE